MEGVTDTGNPAITLNGAGLLSTLGAEYMYAKCDTILIYTDRCPARLYRRL